MNSVVAVLKFAVAILMSLSQLITPYVQIVFHGGLDNFFENWSANDAYTADYAVNIEKTPGKDFVILNFADIQLSDDNLYGEDGDFTRELLDAKIKEVKPDLITLTGDNVSCEMGYIWLVDFLDSYKIPWAPVMGNHDGNNGNRILEGWDSYVLSHAKYCLYKFGPKDMGYGNYVINITENGKIIHTLYMMDTHSNASDTEAGVINQTVDADGNVVSGYDGLWANQIEWYKWAVKGTEKLAGRNVESSLFIHIPIKEYRTARDLMCDYIDSDNDGNPDRWVLKEGQAGFGLNGEDVCDPQGNNGFFAELLKLDSTKNIIAGHDHKNMLSLNYEGVNLNYGLKSGHGSYYSDEMMGASTLTIDSDGHATFAHTPYVIAK